MGIFQQAKPVWLNGIEGKFNQLVGFHWQMKQSTISEVNIAIACRSYYRLYLNGKMLASGPARTAHGYCRVDLIKSELCPGDHLALEVLVNRNPENYSNDSTLEPGLACLEIQDVSGEVLTSLEDGSWSCRELKSRRMNVELMSHSRGIVEVYDYDENTCDWKFGFGEGWQQPSLITGKVNFLKRRAPYPNYKRINFKRLMRVSDLKEEQKICYEEDVNLVLTGIFHPKFYEKVPEENRILNHLFMEEEATFTGNYQIINGDEIYCQPQSEATALTFSLESLEVGYLGIDIRIEQDCVLDILNADVLNQTGRVSPNTFLTRYYLKAGKYHLLTFETKLAKYVKCIFRTKGAFLLNFPYLLDSSYPDSQESYFTCSDGELNEIYEASRRTLRLNTSDIFMDCPQRERGGWLCDSYFTSMGAYYLLNDKAVEKDFLENFLLTNATKNNHGFFPEVYPASKKDISDVGIKNWSFWFVLELAKYYDLTGDREFIDLHSERVAAFISGLLSFRGESGLLENLSPIFVDWSLSNNTQNLYPISIPVNALASKTLEKAGELYHRKDWIDAGQAFKKVLDSLSVVDSVSRFSGEGAVYQEGEIKRQGFYTESGIALEIWSGLHRENDTILRRFIEQMGYAPKKLSDPNIAKSNLFIGLMVRFDTLLALGQVEQFVNEIKKVYLHQLKIGPGTLFEAYHEESGCHGFNGAVGAMITQYILGLRDPKERTKTVKISPCLCNLDWAQGAFLTSDGRIELSWYADHYHHILNISLNLPSDWTSELMLSNELATWQVILNGKKVK